MLGPWHASVLISMHALGLSLCRLGRATEALDLYRPVLDIQRSQFGLNHWESLMTLLDLCDALESLQEGYEEMGGLCRAALRAIEPRPGELGDGERLRQGNRRHSAAVVSSAKPLGCRHRHE